MGLLTRCAAAPSRTASWGKELPSSKRLRIDMGSGTINIQVTSHQLSYWSCFSHFYLHLQAMHFSWTLKKCTLLGWCFQNWLNSINPTESQWDSGWYFQGIVSILTACITSAEVYKGFLFMHIVLSETNKPVKRSWAVLLWFIHLYWPLFSLSITDQCLDTFRWQTCGYSANMHLSTFSPLKTGLHLLNHHGLVRK